MKLHYSYIYLIGFVVVVIALALLINYLTPKETLNAGIKPEALTSFVSSNLKGEHVPQLDVVTLPDVSIAKWDTEKGNFTAYVSKNLNGQGLREYRIVIRTSQVYQSLDTDFVGSFLQSVGGNWMCGMSSGELRICNSLSVTLNGKEGKTVLMYPNSTAIVVCRIPFTSDLYLQKTSCL